MADLHISVQLLHPAAKIPHYSHNGPWGDLAADLASCSTWNIAPGETVAVPTGIAFGLPDGFGALVEDRSGLALKGLTTLAGVIDPGYRGEIKVVLTNLSQQPIVLNAGDRIAQLRIVRRLQAEFVQVETLDETQRNLGGFGSTGV